MNDDQDTSPECPSDGALAAYAEGKSSKGDSAALLAHFAGCDTCRRIVAEGARAQASAFGSGPPTGDDDLDATTDARDGSLPQRALVPGTSIGRYQVLS